MVCPGQTGHTITLVYFLFLRIPPSFITSIVSFRECPWQQASPVWL